MAENPSTNTGHPDQYQSKTAELSAAETACKRNALPRSKSVSNRNAGNENQHRVVSATEEL
jgi:hypothetical protein